MNNPKLTSLRAAMQKASDAIDRHEHVAYELGEVKHPACVAAVNRAKDGAVESLQGLSNAMQESGLLDAPHERFQKLMATSSTKL